MGNEYSRRNSLQSGEDGTVPQTTSTPSPLKFHSIHGENVQLSQNCTVATRSDGFCKGVVFSQRPVSVNEYIYIKFLDVSSSWSGGLRIGFTDNDPTSYKYCLPRYACPCMTEMPGNWARAIAERYVKENIVLFYYVNENGEVHYGLNNVERGIFFDGVNTSGQLWALMDLYGNSTQIQLLPDPFRLLGGRQRPDNEFRNTALHALRNAARRMESMNRSVLCPRFFHEKHGRGVTLVENRSLAVKDDGFTGYGYVFSDSHIELDHFYVMTIANCERGYSEVIFGLTSCDPSNLSTDTLPVCPYDLFDRPEYWIVHTIRERCEISDKFAFVVNGEGAVRYTKNGSFLSEVFHVDHSLNLWFFFCVSESITELQFEGSWSTTDSEVMALLQSLHTEGSNDSESQPPVIGKLSSSPSQAPSENSNECIICYEADKNTALYRCGHVCTCFGCATHLFRSSKPQCPVCREVIIDVVKLYK